MFDQDDYGKDGWRSALDESLWVRLGLSPDPNVDAQGILDSYRPRYQWWRHKLNQLQQGQQANPIVGKVAPHIDTAFKNLVEARDCLGDPLRRRSYEQGRLAAHTAKWRQKIEPLVAIAVQDDGILSPAEKAGILQVASTEGIPPALVNEIIAGALSALGAREGVPGQAPLSTSPRLHRTHYEILGVDERASAEDIEASYRREHRTYIDDRDKARASARFFVITEAYEVLRDLKKREHYDDELKEERRRDAAPGVPKLEVNASDFDFRDVPRGETRQVAVNLRNVGGGSLQGSYRSDRKWLKPRRSAIDTSYHDQTLVVDILTSGLPLGFTDRGTVTIDSNGGTANISVALAVRVPEVALKQFSAAVATAAAVVGGLSAVAAISAGLGLPIVPTSHLWIAFLFATIGGALVVIRFDPDVAFGVGAFSLVALLIVWAFSRPAAWVFAWSEAFAGAGAMAAKPIFALREAQQQGSWDNRETRRLLSTLMILAVPFLLLGSLLWTQSPPNFNRGTASAPPAAPPSPTVFPGYATSNVILRDGSGAKLGLLPKGAAIQVVGREAARLHVRWESPRGSVEGWVAADYVGFGTPSPPSVPAAAERASSQSNDAANQSVARAQALFEGGAYQDAMEECNAALRLQPNSRAALSLKARLEETIRILGADSNAAPAVAADETKDGGRVAPHRPPAETPDNATEIRIQPGDQLEAEIANVDDIATISVNGQNAVQVRYSGGPGRSGRVSLNKLLRRGTNECRLQVWNHSGCCAVSGRFELRLNGTVLVRRNFAQQSSREGIHFDETVGIVVE